ncbi:MAG TPA: hypothetical protein VGP07_20940 [Polyangia bacterium]
MVAGCMGWVGGLALLGCAAPTTAIRQAPADIRGNAAVSGAAARPLVLGPIKLLHVNSDRRTEPKFSRVWSRDGARDCRNATPLAWDGETEVYIGKDELVCVTADRPSRISWHGRSVANEQPASQQASR